MPSGEKRDGAFGRPASIAASEIGELADVLAEVGARGLADALGAAAEVDLVQVEREDLVLGQLLLEPPGEDHLLQLAVEAALGREQQALHRLLRDGAAALHDLARLDVGPGGAHDRAQVDAAVLEERVVLAGDEGEDHVLGQLVEAHQPAALLEELADRTAVAVVDRRGERRPVVVDPVEVGQIAHHGEVEREPVPTTPAATSTTKPTSASTMREGQDIRQRLRGMTRKLADALEAALPKPNRAPGVAHVAAPLSLLFVMDPIGSIDIDTDTTFALMLEAQERGHRVLYCELADLSLEEGRPVARVRARRPCVARVGDHATLGEPRTLPLDDAVDVVFQRKDPPVDADYVTATQILALCRRALVLNRPDTVIWANEKLYACHFPDLMPETRVTRRMPEFMDFLAKLGGEMIVKPLDGKGGEGVFHLRHDDRNLFSILEQVDRIRDALGDGAAVRPRGAPRRQADPAPRRRAARRRAAGAGRRRDPRQPPRRRHGRPDRPRRARPPHRRAPRPHLLRDGLFFVGIDVIGGRLTEVNVTSPTGIQEIDALEGVRLEGRVIERLEQRVDERKKTA